MSEVLALQAIPSDLNTPDAVHAGSEYSVICDAPSYVSLFLC